MSILPSHLQKVVRERAQCPAVVEEFNRFYSLDLSCPITKLLEDDWTAGTSQAEAIQLGMFVAFVQLTLCEGPNDDTQEQA